MKKIFLLGLSFVSVFVVKAQNLDDINEMIGKSQFKEAKAAVEKFLSNPKKANDATAWFYKAVICNSLSKDPTVSQEESYTLKEEAYNCFKKNQILDPKDIQLTFQQHIPYLDLYYEFTNLGVKQFNDKKFDAALSSFKKADEVKDYIISKKYEYEQAKLYPLDTGLVRNIAITALQAKKEDESILYLNKLIQANVSGEEFLDVYSTVAEYHLKKNDLAALNEVAARGKKLYPSSNYWFDLEIRSLGEHPQKEALLAKYKDLTEKNPQSFYLMYNYGVELFKNMNGKEILTPEDTKDEEFLTEVLKKAAALEGTDDVAATVLLSNHLYRYAYDLQNTANSIKGAKPEDVKKKKSFKDASLKVVDDCLANCIKATEFIEKVKEKTSLQKANYRVLLGFMKEIYETKGDKVKVTEIEGKIKNAD